MKSLREYITESEQWIDSPAVGDDFAINIREDVLLETYVLEADDDRIVLASDDELVTVLEEYGMLDELEPLDEAEYRGRKVPLGKPMRGDVAKFKVFVKDPKTGNVKKVNFGDKTMRIKKNIPARRKSFRARHRCSNPGPRTKARYWSCRAW
jgi:hypothetical protein